MWHSGDRNDGWSGPDGGSGVDAIIEGDAIEQDGDGAWDGPEMKTVSCEPFDDEVVVDDGAPFYGDESECELEAEDLIENHFGVSRPLEVVDLSQMESLGAHLRCERERRGRTVQQVERETKIPEDYIAALEQDRLDHLPVAYVRGFLRTYARYLGLDVEYCLRRFRKENGRVPAGRTPSPAAGPIYCETSRSPMRGAVWTGLLMAVIAGFSAGWYVLANGGSGSDKTAEFAAGVPVVATSSILQSSVAAERPAATGLAYADKRPSGYVRPASLTERVGVLQTGAIIGRGVEPTILSHDTVRGKVRTEKVAPGAPGSILSGADYGESGKVYGPSEAHIVLKAVAPVWIRIENEAAQVVFQRVLNRGDLYRVDPTLRSVLSVRDAGAIDVIVDGDVLGPLGDSGKPVLAKPLQVAAFAKSQAVSSH